MKKNIKISLLLITFIVLNLMVKSYAEIRDNNDLINKEIKFLEDVYNVALTKDISGNMNTAGIDMQAPGALRLIGFDLDKIQDSLYIDDKNDSAFQISKSIITLVGAGLNPREYNEDGKIRDLVKELEDMQQDTGEFMGKGREYEKGSIYSQVRAIVALDMVDGNYNEDKAVEKLIEVYKNRGEKGNINNKLIEAEGLCLLALSNHKDKENVKHMIDYMLKVIKDNQNNDAGFNMRSAGEKGTNSPLAIARVIQGLIANGIDPLAKEWQVNGKTMLDALLKSKIVKKDLESSGYGRGEESLYSYEGCTTLALAALVDIKNNVSMFDLLKLKNDCDVKYVGDNKLKDNNIFSSKYRINNKLNKDKEFVIITSLYDKKTHKLVDYNISNKVVKGKRKVIISSGLKIYNSDNVYVKVFLWDNLQNQNILYKTLKIEN